MADDDNRMAVEDGPLVNLLLDFPDSLLLETLTYLDATDLYSFLQGISCRRAVAENQAFVQHILERERLPGKSLNDLLYHVERWECYKSKLRQGLFEIVLEEQQDKKEHDAHDSNSTFTSTCVNSRQPRDDKDIEAVRTFLRDAIYNFTNRAAGLEQWYEKLPLGPGTSFEFGLSLTANMRRVKGDWIELSEGDGTRVLPTWLSTQNYRKEYGFFNFFSSKSWASSTPTISRRPKWYKRNNSHQLPLLGCLRHRRQSILCPS
mmetsp:Transcript_12206/g.33877  ORF Transcript_12206/g.33877 Transcript_12206/m.33877 type:complete len:262 (-) Transcript_12206:689-1474(-)